MYSAKNHNFEKIPPSNSIYCNSMYIMQIR